MPQSVVRIWSSCTFLVLIATAKANGPCAEINSQLPKACEISDDCLSFKCKLKVDGLINEEVSLKADICASKPSLKMNLLGHKTALTAGKSIDISAFEIKLQKFDFSKDGNSFEISIAILQCMIPIPCLDILKLDLPPLPIRKSSFCEKSSPANLGYVGDIPILYLIIGGGGLLILIAVPVTICLVKRSQRPKGYHLVMGDMPQMNIQSQSSYP